MANDNEMERDLANAVEASIASPNVRGGIMRSIQGNGVANLAAGTSRRAVDMLAQAVAGLMKVEQQLNELTQEIAGEMKTEAPQDKTGGSAPEGLPMFDRVRADATALAELAMRMHQRIQHARERL